MKKILLLTILFLSFLNAEVFWNDIYKYESIKINDDKYQVKTINKSDFIENHLFLNKKNNNLIKNSKKCQYITERKHNNTKTLSFIGDGSIQCDYEAIQFISKHLELNDAEHSRIILYDALLLTIPYILSLLFILIFTIVSLQTRKKNHFFIGLFLALVIYGANLKYGSELHKAALNKMVHSTIYDFERCNKDNYYIDPTLLKE